MACFKFDKLDKIVIALTFIVVTMFSIYNCFCFASDFEELETSIANGVLITPNRNFFINDISGGTTYVKMERGYKYYIEVSDVPSDRFIAISKEIPSVNVTYDYIGSSSANSTYTYIPDGDFYFLCSSPANASEVKYYRERIEGMDNAISDLVDFVGINSYWNVFEISLPYVLIVVCVAFGIYLIIRMIKGLSKGKGRI